MFVRYPHWACRPQFMFSFAATSRFIFLTCSQPALIREWIVGFDMVHNVHLRLPLFISHLYIHACINMVNVANKKCFIFRLQSDRIYSINQSVVYTNIFAAQLKIKIYIFKTEKHQGFKTAWDRFQPLNMHSFAHTCLILYVCVNPCRTRALHCKIML